MSAALLIDLILAGLWIGMVLWSVRRGFFVSALTLGAWIVSVALAGFLSAALAPPLYEAVGAATAQKMIAQHIDSAIQGSQAAQYAQTVLAELPKAVQRLAELGGISTPSLIANLQAYQFSSASAAELLEKNLVAPIAVSVCRVGLSVVLFAISLFVTRLITRQVSKLRKLPVLKQADKLLGAALGLVKGALLVFVIALALRALTALGIGGPAFAQQVEQAKLVQAASAIFHV